MALPLSIAENLSRLPAQLLSLLEAALAQFTVDPQPSSRAARHRPPPAFFQLRQYQAQLAPVADPLIELFQKLEHMGVGRDPADA